MISRAIAERWAAYGGKVAPRNGTNYEILSFVLSNVTTLTGQEQHFEAEGALSFPYRDIDAIPRERRTLGTILPQPKKISSRYGAQLFSTCVEVHSALRQ